MSKNITNLAVQLYSLDLELKRHISEKAAANGSANARNFAPELLAGFLPEEIDDGRAEPDVAPNGFIETADLTDVSSLDIEDRLIAKIDGGEEVTRGGEEFFESFADLNDEDEGDEPDYLAVRVKTAKTAVTVINAIKTEPVASKRPTLPEVPAKLDPMDIGHDRGPNKSGRRETMAQAKFFTSAAPAKKHIGRKGQNRKGQQSIRNPGSPINVRLPTLDSLLKKTETDSEKTEKPVVMIVCRRTR